MKHPATVFAFAAIALSSNSAQAHVSASIQQDHTEPHVVVVTVTYKNAGPHDAYIREADMPHKMRDGRLWSNAFQATSKQGETARYTGVIVNLTPEAQNSRITLRPGEEKSISVNLSQNYDLRPSTEYDITLRGFEHYEPENTPTFTTPKSIRIRTGSTREQSQGQVQTELPYPGTLCPPEKMLGILQALPAASTMAQDASDYVDGLYERVHAPGEIKYKFKQTPRYTTWFGIHGDPNVENKTNTRIRKVLSSTANRVRFLKPSCECAEEDADRVIAWVDPNSDHVVNYCPKFFKLPIGPGVRGGSRARTIYHEASHFSDSLAKGTEDYDAYFALPEDARKLAIDARDVASDHAYSYEYFVDNLDNQE